MKGRYEIFKNGKGLAFGKDHACGDFIQIWDASKSTIPDVDNVLVDEDVLLTGLTRERMMELLKEHGFTEEDLAKEHDKQRSRE